MVKEYKEKKLEINNVNMDVNFFITVNIKLDDFSGFRIEIDFL